MRLRQILSRCHPDLYIRPYIEEKLKSPQTLRKYKLDKRKITAMFRVSSTPLTYTNLACVPTVMCYLAQLPLGQEFGWLVSLFRPAGHAAGRFV